ncbi:c-type cytochrome biogenesis protein CcsB [Nocardioides sp. SOB77]|uniref:C-type cytochrome biogenesis protein CcsB n=1 Tax=Nocardioides oceani TaxID=3058369 RepID=A0ABT8FMU3_9ACTN|nr:c-type cytochrome biogenesis protein CcsB [Nocardioides oceani]MDN4175785.1 c-type cytochrome biogenesis protein CcsB [Nocardioides oceani]
MSPSTYAMFSDRAVAFAFVVYGLAALAYLAEWAQSRLGERPRRPEPEPKANWESGRVGELSGRVGVALTAAAALIHAAALISRGLAADRVPWGNMYEFALAGSFAAVALYLALSLALRMRWLGLPLSFLVLATLMTAALTLYVPAGPLVPALQSFWLVIHVIAAIIATGAFTLGTLTSILYLGQQRRERKSLDAPRATRASNGDHDEARAPSPLTPTIGRRAHSISNRSAATDIVPAGDAGPRDETATRGNRLPPADVIDLVTYRIHAFAFPVWTFAALIAGPIWAKYAWGRYWAWDPKEVWAFISWVVYAAYLHARATAGWGGRRSAVVALIGFATILFNFIGINLFGGGLHSYAGL